jgi:hypothetical protein
MPMWSCQEGNRQMAYTQVTPKLLNWFLEVNIVFRNTNFHGFLRHSAITRFRYVKKRPQFLLRSYILSHRTAPMWARILKWTTTYIQPLCVTCFASNTYRLCHNCSCSSPVHSCVPRNVFYQVIASATRDSNVFGQAVPKNKFFLVLSDRIVQMLSCKTKDFDI